MSEETTKTTKKTKKETHIQRSFLTGKETITLATDATTRASKLLANISAADIMTRELVEMVEAIFHIEDLYTLAQRNSIIALNFWQLICNIDYVILQPGQMNPAGETNVLSEVLEFIGVTGTAFPYTVKGKIGAVAECFKIQATKMNTLIDTNLIKQVIDATGAAQIAQDALNAFLGGGMMVAKEAVKALPLMAAGA